MTSRHPFSALIERKFLEWQLSQQGRRTQAEFATYLGVKRTSLTMWMNGDHLPEGDNVHKLAIVLGPEVYEVLDQEPPNPYLYKITKVFPRLSPEHQQRLAEDAERYEANNNTERSSTKRKAPTDK
jgi:transcriptional regulator with XRE-family HTH domain